MNISEVLPNGNVRVVVPIKFRCVKQTKVIVFPENEIGIQMQTPLLTAIANALAWQQMLDEGVIPSVDALAKHVGKERAIVSHTLQLAQLSPEIIHMAIIGTLPKEITLKTFRPSSRLGRTEEDAWHRVDLQRFCMLQNRFIIHASSGQNPWSYFYTNKNEMLW